MKTLSTLLFATVATITVASEAAAQCVTRPSTGATCSESLADCSRQTRGGTTLAGCRAAHAECMRTGRWIYRFKEGNCYDWGTRRKE